VGQAELEELGPIDYVVMEWPGPSPDASEVQPLLLDPHRHHRRHRHRGQQPRLAPPGRTLAAPGDLPVRAAGARARGPGGRLVFLTNSVLATYRHRPVGQPVAGGGPLGRAAQVADGYEPSRPTSWTRWTASLREEAPSLR
jgi:hypothetical protein